MLKALIHLSILTIVTAGKDCGSLYTGREFLIMAPIIPQHHHTPNLPKLCQLIVYGDENTTVTVRTQSPSTNETKVIGSIGSAIFDYNYDQVAINTTNNDKTVQVKGILVTSNRPIGVVVHVNGTDGYSAVPRNEDNVYAASSASEDESKSYIAVSAFEDNTKVTIVVRISKKEARFNGKKYSDGEQISFQLDAFHVLVVSGEGDLTGSTIEGHYNKGVSVFSGIACEPEKCAGFLEQLLPISKFGKRHLLFPLNDTALGLLIVKEYKAIALHVKTAVNISGKRDVKLLEKVGDFVKFSSQIATRYHADSPVMPVQILKTNNDLPFVHYVHTTLVSHRCQSSSYRFVALSDYTTTLVITIQNADGLDEVTLDEKGLKDVAVYVHGRVIAVVPEVSSGLHTVTSPGGKLMAVYVYGTSNYSAVSYHAASWEKPVQKVNASTSLLSRQTAYSNSPLVPVVNSNQTVEKLDTSMATAPPTRLMALSTTITSISSTQLLASSLTSSTLQSTPAAIMLTSSMSPSIFKSTSSSSVLASSMSSSTMESTSATRMLTSSMSSSTLKSTFVSGVLVSSLIMTSTTAIPTPTASVTTPTTATAASAASSSSAAATTTTATLIQESSTRLVSSHSNNSLCRCTCQFQPPSPGSDTQRRRLLPVVKGTTGKHKRKLTSAPDDRPTATGFGVMGIVVIVIPLAVLLVADLGRIVKYMTA